MSRTKKNGQLAEDIFKPDKVTGISNWKTREEIDVTLLKLGTNGNIRQNTPWTDKYIWEIKRKNNKPRGTPEQFRTIGFSTESITRAPPREKIRNDLLRKYKGCIHCGSHKDLCIDHKNDMYNDQIVLCSGTQLEEHFQVLCNKCNKDLKHQDNEKEKKTMKLHRVRGLNVLPFINDTFEYPWEVGLTEYNESDINCKNYTYWYDPEAFHHKRDWYVNIRHVNRRIKLIS